MEQAVLRLTDVGQWRESTQQPEPDAERLAVTAPRGLAVLRHSDQRHDGVADHRECEQLTAVGVDDELEPDEEAEADEGRPRSKLLRPRPGLEPGDAKPAEQRGAEGVQGAERLDRAPQRTADGGD